MTRAKDMANVLPIFNETIGSSATFPSGHIIQTFTDSYDGVSTDIGGTADDYLGSNLEVTITPKSTSNTLIVRCSLGNYYNNAGTQRKLTAGFRYHADWTGTPVLFGPFQFPVSQFGRFQDSKLLMVALYYEMITTAPVTTVMKIRPWLEAPAGDVQLFNGGAGGATLSVMEVQA